MSLVFNQYHRKSIRLKGYDYSQHGGYFLTICLHHQTCLFGKIVGEKMELNDAGRMVERWWLELRNKFPRVDPGEYIIMPNHFHGILVVVELAIVGSAMDGYVTLPNQPDPTVGAAMDSYVTLPNQPDSTVGAALCGRPVLCGRQISDGGEGHPHRGVNKGHPHRGAPTVGDIVDWFKTMTTNEYIRGVKRSGWAKFPGKLWQRNYYEHIVRDEDELNRIREYIIMNPAQWAWDTQNPVAVQKPVAETPWKI